MAENLGPTLVTGASGFIGRHLVRALLRQNRKVIALSRRMESLAELQSPSLRAITGDVQDPDSYLPHLSRDTTVFHLAAMRGMTAGPPEFFQRVNEEASLELAKSCATAGVAKFVYVSSAAVYGSSCGRLVSEQLEMSSQWREDPYLRSRVRALREMRKLISLGLPLVTICPTIVFGPDERFHRNRVTDQIRLLLRSRVEVYVEGGNQPRDLVYIDDVVQGILLAEERGAMGEEFILGGESISHRQLNQTVLALANRTSWLQVSVPMKMAVAIAQVYEKFGGRREGSGFPVMVRKLAAEWQFSSEKARRMLGYCSTPLQESLRKTVEFIQREAS